MLVLRYQFLVSRESKSKFGYVLPLAFTVCLRLSSFVSENIVYFSFKSGMRLYFHNRHLAELYLFFPILGIKKLFRTEILQWIT